MKNHFNLNQKYVKIGFTLFESDDDSISHVIDYTREDFTKSGRHYDLILAVRKTRPVWAIQRALSSQGTYISTASGSSVRLFQELILGPRLFRNSNKQIAVITTTANQKDLIFIKELIEKGKLKPVIDRCYPLSEVPEAFRYYARGHARGKVMITVKTAKGSAVVPW